MSSWLKKHPKGTLLALYIQPGASSDSFAGLFAERLKVKLKARPKDGEANAGLLEFLSEALNVSKTKIHLIRGESSRQKDLLVELPPEKILILELEQR